MLCVLMIIDKADQGLMPAVYLEVCSTFSVGPAFLGTMTACRGLTQSAAALLAGPLCKRFHKISVVSAGCLCWAAASVAIAVATESGFLMAARAANGLGLGLVTPIIFALVVDIAPDKQRGRAFGLLLFSAQLGSTLLTSAAIEIAGRSPHLGWRLSFALISIISVIAAVMLAAFGVEPPRTSTALVHELRRIDSGQASHTSVGRTRNGVIPNSHTAFSDCREMLSILSIRSFCVILLQGAAGSIPWYAASFLPLYLEERLGARASTSAEETHDTAAVLVAIFGGGTTVGAIIGGVLNDFAGRASPNHGRVWVAQVSAGASAPLFLAIFYALPAMQCAALQ